MRIGIIGLGDIGGNLAAWLAQSGHEVWGYDIDPEASARAAGRSVTLVRSRPALVENAQVIVTSLADLEAVRTTYHAAHGLVALAGLDRLTEPPRVCRRLVGLRPAPR